MLIALAAASDDEWKQSEFGPIPSNWEVRDAIDYNPYITSGSRGWAKYYSEYGHPFVRITNLSHGDIYPDLSDIRYVDVDESDAEARRTCLMQGDVLISITADIGAVGYVDSKFPRPAYINQHIACLRLPIDKIDGRFIAYFLSSTGPQRRFSAMVDVGAKSGLNLTTIGRIKLLCPPLQEQKAIAVALSDADALIESLETLIAKKRAIKQGAMQELLTARRRLPGFTEEWVSVRLDEVAKIRSGGTPSTSQQNYWNGDVPWCTPTDVTALEGKKYLMQTRRTISPSGLNASSAEWIPASSVVMTTRATIGECAINLKPITTNQGFKSLIPHQCIDVEFLYYYMITQKERLISLCGGSTFLEIGKNQLSAYELTIPKEKAEQISIAAVLADLDVDIELLNTRLAKVYQLKKGMMQELLTGRVRLA